MQRPSTAVECIKCGLLFSDYIPNDHICELKTGVKYDEGKPHWSLLPPEALEEVVKVYTFGAKKYAPNNWRKGMAWSRTFSAIMRHCWSFWSGETLDPETGLHHLAHAAFGCLTLIEYTKKKTATDDRVK